MSDAEMTALATVLLVIVGVAQVMILLAQRLQQRLDWAEIYRRRWIEIQKDWATVVFLGRGASSYYQVAHHDFLQELRKVSVTSSAGIASSWALTSVRNIFGLFSDLSSRVLQGQINVHEIYSIFGTELLRHGAPLRALLDGESEYLICYGSIGSTAEEAKHDQLRSEMTTWLACHDGIRRRALILIDLLWAEAARLEDLPPYELASAANSKHVTGNLNRARVRAEVFRLNGWLGWKRSICLANYLRYAEWKRFKWSRGLLKERIIKLDEEWTQRYLKS